MKFHTLQGKDGQPDVLILLEWPDVQQLITRDNPVWRTDRSLASYEWDSTGDLCTYEQAKKLASVWGAAEP